MKNRITGLLEKFAAMVAEDSDPTPTPTKPNASLNPVKGLGGSLNIDKLKVKGGDNTNLEPKGNLSSLIKGMDAPKKPSAEFPLDAKNYTLNTGTELMEDDNPFGGSEDDEEEQEPDFGGDDADLDSDLDQPFEDEESPVGDDDMPAEGGEGGDEDILAHVDALLRKALDDKSISVQIGLNQPNVAGAGEPDGDEGLPDMDEPEAAESDEDTFDDATTPVDGDMEDEYGEDAKVMESFLNGSNQKKNSNEDDEDDSEGEDDETPGEGEGGEDNYNDDESTLGY